MKTSLRVLAVAMLMLMIASVPAIEGNSGGKHNQGSAGCTCHGSAGGVSVGENFPTSYTAGQSYAITISVNGATGTAGGFSLQVDKGTLGNPNPNVQIAGKSVTHANSNQRSFTFDWIAPAANSGTVTVDVAVLAANGNFGTSGDSWAKTSISIAEVAPVNSPPTISNLALSPRDSVGVDQALTVSYDFADADGDSEVNSEIRWFVNGTVVPAHNNMMTVPSSATSIDQRWTVSVTPSDGMDFGPEEICPDEAMIVDIDSDGDGVFDSDDAFPNDASETMDSDGDGVGDNADAFPQDASETLDSDGDGVGNNADAFDFDASETTDSDMDGVGDNSDAFPNDASETTDTDGDLVGDNGDAFPNDANETADTDGDGVGDNADAFPDDATETIDSDGDGVGDNADAFPNNANETMDSDMDGVGDNADAFPNDETETMDSDMDGTGDNADAFPNDASETIDSDGDGVGDNADAFANDASETLDSDGDLVGDNADWAPNDATESADSDNDGVGDNADAFPNDATETMDSDGNGVGDIAQAAAEAAEAAAAEEAAAAQHDHRSFGCRRLDWWRSSALFAPQHRQRG